MPPREMSKKGVAECRQVRRLGSDAARADLRSSTGERITNHVGAGKARNTSTSVIESIGKSRVRMSCLRADDPRDLNPFHRIPDHTPAEETLAGTASAMGSLCLPTIIAPGKGAPECASVQGCCFI